MQQNEERKFLKNIVRIGRQATRPQQTWNGYHSMQVFEEHQQKSNKRTKTANVSSKVPPREKASSVRTSQDSLRLQILEK